MAKDTYTPLLSEVLKKVHNAKTKDKKVEILKQYDCEPLRMVIKSSFDPNIEWLIPEGEVPFKGTKQKKEQNIHASKRSKKIVSFYKGW
jgi:hypothetical protein